LSDLIIKLLSSEHDAVQRFVLRKMREFNTVKVVKILIENLAHHDPRIRDLAAESLCWLDSARNILLDNLLKEKDAGRARLITKILKPHSTKFRKDQIRKLGDNLKKQLDKNDPLQETSIFLLKTCAPDFLHDFLLSRATEFKKRKKYKEAINTLEILRKSEHFGVDGQYLLAVCLLKLSPKKLIKHLRDKDSCIEIFQKLIKNDTFPLAQKLKSESALDPADLFYVGFHFSERTQHERLFGGELLRSLARKKSNAKIIKASREKVRAEKL